MPRARAAEMIIEAYTGVELTRAVFDPPHLLTYITSSLTFTNPFNSCAWDSCPSHVEQSKRRIEPRFLPLVSEIGHHSANGWRD